MKKILIGLVVVTLVVLGALSYIGVAPVLSAPFNKPKDLGVKAKPKQVYDMEKAYADLDETDKVDVDMTLTSEQVTSVFAVWELRDTNYPFKNVQVKFSPDGTGEASGIIKLPVVVSLAKSLGYSDTEINSAKKYVQFVAGDLPFYLKGTGAITNNQISMSPAQLQIGKVTVPEQILTPLVSLATDMIERRIEQIGGADIKTANFSDGSFHLDARVPASIVY